MKEFILILVLTNGYHNETISTTSVGGFKSLSACQTAINLIEADIKVANNLNTLKDGKIISAPCHPNK